MKEIYGVLNSAMGQEQRLNIIANNLANAGTVGFKQDRSLFTDLMKAAGEGAETGGDAEAPEGQPAIASLTRSYTDFGVGPAQPSGGPLDLMIEGDGFFEIEGPGGKSFYTRAGNFSLNEAGELVTASGRRVLDGTGGPVAIGPTAAGLVVTPDGELQVDGAPVGRIEVVNFADPNVLVKYGEGLFEAPDDVVPEPSLDARLRQGYLEGSNVRTIQEMVLMIENQRAFEANQKTIQTVDEAVGRRIGQILNG